MISDTPSLRLFLLGRFRVERDGRSLLLANRKVESLLAYLVLYPQLHAREKLAALCWGDFPDAQARASLRNALPILRKFLGSEVIVSDRESVQLNPAFPLWVDAREFQSEAGELLAASPPDPSLLNFDLYRGDLLPDFYDDWIMPLREHYRTLHLDCLLRLTQYMRSLSEYERAIQLSQKVLAIDPANERAHQHLMFCYVATGERNVALRQYEQCQRALREELAVAPAPETTALYQWIQQTPTGTKSPAALPTNLPIPLSSFVGRKQAMSEVKRLLGTRRLVSLVGAGGSGKTRLAIQVATDLIDAFKDGVWWVELASLTDAALVPQAVAKALGVRESPHQSVSEMLANDLRSKQVLLVLDNCEHLLMACAQLADELLRVCPDLKLLATSREPLGLTGEMVWHVPTLSTPDPQQLSLARLLMSYESVHLLVERATAIKPNFTLSEQNALAVAQVCQQLDGIPLAIELAAARTNVLSVEEIATHLDDRFNLLTMGSRTALPRQQTLRATIDWSYDLLPTEERALFRRLAVFAGGFTLDAAEAVCSERSAGSSAASLPFTVQRSPFTDTLDLLSHLVDKSLVIAEGEGERIRCRMLETIRLHAQVRLRESGEAEPVRNRHLTYFLQWAEAAEPRLNSAERSVWVARLETEHDNLRAALEWSQTSRQTDLGLRLAGALVIFWSRRSYWSEGRGWLEALLNAARETHSPQASVPWAKALAGIGRLAWAQSDYAGARAPLEQSVALWRELADPSGLAQSLSHLGMFWLEQGDHTAARVLLKESIGLFRALADQWGLAWALFCLGRAAHRAGDYAESWAISQEGLALSRAIGDTAGVAATLRTLGIVAADQGDYVAARSLLEESVAIRREVGEKRGWVISLNSLGELALLQGDDSRAKAYFEESLALSRSVGYQRGIAVSLNGLGALAQAKRDHTLARSLLEESLRLSQEQGDPWTHADALYNLGASARHGGDSKRAAALFTVSLRVNRAIKDEAGMALCLAALARLAEAEAQAERAARLFGAAHALRDVHRLMSPSERDDYEQSVAVVRARLGDSAFAALWAEGEHMIREEAVALALTSE